MAYDSLMQQLLNNGGCGTAFERSFDDDLDFDAEPWDSELPDRVIMGDNTEPRADKPREPEDDWQACESCGIMTTSECSNSGCTARICRS